MDHEKRTGALLVVMQMVLLASLALHPMVSQVSLGDAIATMAGVTGIVGLGVAVGGALSLGRSLTPMPIPTEHSELHTGGLFRFVRHPIYSGLMLWALSWTVRNVSVLQVVSCVALVVLLTIKSAWEESKLRAKFSGYQAYAQRTGRFFPRLPSR